jgi:siroheme decarboxylase
MKVNQMTVNELDQKIISALQGDLPLTEKPFASLAEETGLTEDKLLKRIQSYLKSGKMRRLGAILRHNQAGFTANAMCCWSVPEQIVEEVGNIMKTFSEASHVFQRLTYPDWPYNIYTMLHGQSEQELVETAEKISNRTGISDYLMLKSIREFKKTSMKYY